MLKRKSQSHSGQDNIVNETCTQKNYVVTTESLKSQGRKWPLKVILSRFLQQYPDRGVGGSPNISGIAIIIKVIKGFFVGFCVD